MSSPDASRPPVPTPDPAFVLRLGARGPDLRVLSFRGREALGRCHRFEIDLQAPSGAFHDGGRDLLGRAAVLELREGDLARRIPGVLGQVSRVAQAGTGGGAFRAVLVPRIQRLWELREGRGFRDRSPGERIERAMVDGGFVRGLDFELDLREEGRHARAPWTFNPPGESLGDHLVRTLEEEGIFWRIVEEEGRDKVLFLDSVSALEAPGEAIPFRDAGAGIPGIHLLGTVLGAARFQGPGGGGASAGGRIRREALACRASVHEGEGSRVDLEPGRPIRMEEGPAGAYLPVEVEHEGRAEGERAVYRSRFQALDWDGTRPFRLEPRTPVPRWEGLFTGTIAGEGAMPPLDAQGRYPVELPFPEAGEPGSPSVTVPLRRVQPHQGLHLPLKPGTRVALATLDGDPGQLVITGALNTVAEPSGTTGANPEEGTLEQKNLATKVEGDQHSFVARGLTEQVGGIATRLSAAAVGATLAQVGLAPTGVDLKGVQVDRVGWLNQGGWRREVAFTLNRETFRSSSTQTVGLLLDSALGVPTYAAAPYQDLGIVAEARPPVPPPDDLERAAREGLARVPQRGTLRQNLVHLRQDILGSEVKFAGTLEHHLGSLRVVARLDQPTEAYRRWKLHERMGHAFPSFQGSTAEGHVDGVISLEGDVEARLQSGPSHLGISNVEKGGPGPLQAQARDVVALATGRFRARARKGFSLLMDGGDPPPGPPSGDRPHLREALEDPPVEEPVRPYTDLAELDGLVLQLQDALEGELEAVQAARDKLGEDLFRQGLMCTLSTPQEGGDPSPKGLHDYFFESPLTGLLVRENHDLLLATQAVMFLNGLKAMRLASPMINLVARNQLNLRAPLIVLDSGTFTLQGQAVGIVGGSVKVL